jgi:chromosome segregation protein
VYLKSIALQGFKTFASRTTLELRPGITAIVGPNGSGKSNIADAVRWALGETNLRHVRCRSTEELIFAGNARRSTVGFAEVSLVFANEGGWLAVPFNEVRVTRRANRSGENEYLLNGTRVRLRDIVDLLAGASIHAGGHVVVSQGLVDAVLALRPEERRPLIENIAGLKQYYLRRDDAESRLLATESNLVHVDAMIAEIEPQLASLSAQAEALRGYRAAENELHDLQRLTFGAQAARLRDRLATAVDSASAAEGALATTRAEALRLRTEDDRLIVAIAADRRSLDDVRARIDAAHRTLEGARRDRDVAGARAISAEERSAFAHAEHQRLLESRHAEQAELDAIIAEAGLASAEAATAEAALHERGQRAADLARARDRAAMAARQAQARHGDAVRTAAKLADSAVATRAAIDRLLGDIARREAELATATAELQGADLARAAAGEKLVALQAEASTARRARGDAADRLAAARAAAASALGEHQHATRIADQYATRHDVLKTWLLNIERHGSGTRALALASSAAGIVSTALQIDRAWHGAIATVLGARFDAVIATDLAAIIDAWQQPGGSRGHTWIVPASLSAVGEPGAHESAAIALSGDAASHPSPNTALAFLREIHALAEDEVVGWANQVCADSSGLLDHAGLGLDRVLLVTSTGAALRCAPYAASLAVTVVSADPVLAVLSNGSVVLGVEERIQEVIARTAELDTLGQALDQARAAEKMSAQRSIVARQSLRDAEHDAEMARAALNHLESTLARVGDELRFQERLCSRVETAVSSTAALIARHGVDLSARQRSLAGIDGELGRARQAADDARSVAESALSSARLAEEAVAVAAAARRDDEAALALLRDRERGAARRLEDQTRRLNVHAANLARHAEQERQTLTAISALAAERDQAAAREADAASVLARLEDDQRPVKDLLHEHEAAHADLRTALLGVTERLARAEIGHERARRDADNLARDLDILRAQVVAELGCGVDALPAGAPPAGAVTRMRSLRAELQAIGPINARAEDDLLQIGERLHFLRAQSVDLRDGVARLRGMIADANATVRERFTQTVEALDKEFARFFARLFGGGSCKLVPEYDATGLPTGVEVQAQPPGKRTRDLALLSGGERALIAMALLFGMLRVRPVPFCLLDEVEAALDEANTGRFGTILRELSADTQFILVTHNRGTMLHADRLYGITMSESGVSTAASLALSATRMEADAPADSP